MASRIERTTTSSGTQRATQAPATAETTKAKAAASAAKTAPSTTTAPKDGMGRTVTSELKRIQPDGKPVSSSASPDALWSDAGEVLPSKEAWAAQSPKAKKARLESLEAERDALANKVEKRVKVLQGKWQRVRTSSKGEALRDYQEHTNRLGKRAAKSLDSTLDSVESLQRRINTLRVKAASLERTRNATPDQLKERQLVANQLRELQKQQDEAVRKAVALVENEGLTLDLFAHVEHAIDPDAPLVGTGQALLDQVERLVELTRFITSVLEDTPALALEKAEAKKLAARVSEARLEHERREERVIRKARSERQRGVRL
ncbi:MAG: hypothetical protein JNG84_07560 [Archangium sp.]|nr:hypothetical protein [Archangium sp.]